jgi:hypothetical protein
MTDIVSSPVASEVSVRTAACGSMAGSPATAGGGNQGGDDRPVTAATGHVTAAGRCHATYAAARLVYEVVTTVVGVLVMTVPAVYMHPQISVLISHERQREMMVQADRRRRVRQLSDLARTSRHTGGTGHRPRRAWRGVAELFGLRPRYRAVR